MCGLTGFITPSGDFDAAHAHGVIERMSCALRHRGPDDGGEWIDQGAGVALGFRRLSIVDLSPLGHQPMESPSGRYVIVFNGEVYNHGDIRREIECQAPELARTIRGYSDTAVMLAAFDYWGFEKAVKKFAGMFGMAVVDRVDRVLYLCRDRIGEKPLYYGWLNNSFVFGSELKSIRQHPDFKRDLDAEAIELFLQRSFVPAPHTIYQHVRKLLAGTYLALPLSNPMKRVEPVPYWSVEEAARAGLGNRFEGSEACAVDELEQLLGQTVRREMEADVPLGAFLSGGIDSSLVVALMQAANTNPVKTFSIGFENKAFDEAPHAKAVAQHLGTDHTEMYVTDRDARGVIPLLASMYDEPFADDSQIPTYLVSRLARSEVTVALTGDGGDELFGGYSYYVKAMDAWSRVTKAPHRVRRTAGSVIDLLPDGAIRTVAPVALKMMGQPGLTENSLSRLRNAGQLLRSSADPVTFYTSIVAPPHALLSPEWRRPDIPKQARYPDLRNTSLSPLECMAYFDQVGELTDGILAKVDRASMAVSLETRAPFLDHNVVEWSWRIPPDWKVREGRGKWLLRQLLYRHVPCELVERPKQGFAVPVAEWLRGPLREWATDLIAPGRISSAGIPDKTAVHAEWDRVMRSSDTSASTMWSVLMFQAWLEQEGNPGS